MRNRLKPFLAVTSVLLLAGCAVTSTPPMSLVATPQSLVAGNTNDAAVEQEWWRLFDDPTLEALVSTAFAANRDLRTAIARAEAAQALAGATRLNQLPAGGVGIGATRQHISELEGFGRDLPERSFTVVDTRTTFAWEADVFGRLRGRAAAAAADARAARLDARGVQVAVAAQVAGAYFDYRGAQRDLALLAEMRARSTEVLARTRVMLTAGRVTRVDVLRAEQVDEELRAEHARAAHVRERARLRLAMLTGRIGEGWEVPDEQPRPLRAAVLSVGTASDLLDRRPDVAASQARLLAAAQRAGVSRRDLLPRIEVTGAVGLIGGSLGALADASAASWFIAPRLVWTFLDWPRLRRLIQAADALTDAALAEYESTVLRAIEDVQVTIDAYGAATETLLAAERRSEAAAGVATVVNVQYREGMADSLASTIAQRDAIAGSLAANRARVAHQQAVVAVYRALGGGW